jgi:integrase
MQEPKKRKVARGYEGIYKVKGRKIFKCTVTRRGTDGTSKRVAIYGATKDEVKDKRDREQQTKRLTADPLKISVAEFLNETWLPAIAPLDGVPPAKPRVRASTYEQRKYAVARLVAAPIKGTKFGRMILTKVTRADIFALFDAMEISEPAKGRARQVAFEVLRVALNYAFDREMIEANPTLRVPKPGHKAKPQRHLTEVEVFKLLDAAEKRIIGDNKRERYYALPIVHLLLATGLREGEAFALHRSEYDESAGMITVTSTLTKGKRTEPKTAASRRTILLDQVTRDVLREHLATLDAACPWLFPTGNGKAFDPKNFRKQIFAPLLERAKLAPTKPEDDTITPHDLRGTFATIAQSEGIPDFVVEDILGHRQRSLLGRVYTSATRRMPGEAAKTMGDFFERRRNRKSEIQSEIQPKRKPDEATLPAA